MARPLPALAPEVLARLEAYGSYSYYRPSWLGRWLGVPAEIEWESPIGFENDLAPLALGLWFPASRQGAANELPRLLEAVENLRRNLADELTALRHHLIDCFRECFAEQLDEQDRVRMTDVDGTITDAAILRDVESVHIRFDATGKPLVRTAWIALKWDKEHGLDVEWDTAGQIERPWRE